MSEPQAQEEIKDHMRTKHGYPEPELWPTKSLLELHRLETELLQRGVFEFTDDQVPHEH